MAAILVTGYLGLVGSYCCKYFANLNYDIYGLDNDNRSVFFSDLSPLSPSDRESKNASLCITESFDIDISDKKSVFRAFRAITEKNDIVAVIHCAAQPSHDWAAKDPFFDFNCNALGTLVICEAIREYCCNAILFHMSTNKVYGDSPNLLPLEETCTRYDLDKHHPLYKGINEQFPIDQSKHSLFGCSKLAADIYAQEYSRYFNIKTIVFRGGCLTG